MAQDGDSTNPSTGPDQASSPDEAEPAAVVKLRPPWKPGQSGNPKGLRKKAPELEWFMTNRPYVEPGKPVPDSLKGPDGQIMTRDQLVMSTIFAMATNPRHRDCLRAGELLMAYRYGKPVDRMELTGAQGGPIEHEDATQNLTTGEKRKRLIELEAAVTSRRKLTSVG